MNKIIKKVGYKGMLLKPFDDSKLIYLDSHNTLKEFIIENGLGNQCIYYYFVNSI